jgi:hypothetical protein
MTAAGLASKSVMATRGSALPVAGREGRSSLTLEGRVGWEGLDWWFGLGFSQLSTPLTFLPRDGPLEISTGIARHCSRCWHP